MTKVIDHDSGPQATDIHHLATRRKVTDRLLGPLQTLEALVQVFALPLLEGTLRQELATALGIFTIKDGEILDQSEVEALDDGDDELVIDDLGDVVNGAL